MICFLQHPIYKKTTFIVNQVFFISLLLDAQPQYVAILQQINVFAFLILKKDATGRYSCNRRNISKSLNSRSYTLITYSHR